jgi:hypothetical protein
MNAIPLDYDLADQEVVVSAQSHFDSGKNYRHRLIVIDPSVVRPNPQQSFEECPQLHTHSPFVFWEESPTATPESLWLPIQP